MPTIHDWQVEAYLHESVSLDRTDLNREFARVSSDLAYWGEKYAQAERCHAEAKAEHEQVQARLYRQVRAVLEADAAAKASAAPTKKAPARVTDSHVESEVVLTADYAVAYQEVIDCESAKTRVRMIIEAVKTKRDMLVSLGAQLRAELRGEPHIKDPDWDDWKKTTP
ncbi:MAG: hypothetical protein COA94_06055 [Rickettsiales bacterium]|nr:MAG: hypothetical protein COA94_06055 [Rickettsiales bacterium]